MASSHSPDISQLTATARKLDNETEELEKLLELINTPAKLVENCDIRELPEKYVDLRTVNEKLRYRVEFCKREIAKEMERGEKHMPDLLQTLRALFSHAIRLAFPELYNPPNEQLLEANVSLATKKEYGDYQCNSAMEIAKQLKAKCNRVEAPNKVAERVVEKLSEAAGGEAALKRIVLRTEVAGPGFINVHLQRNYVAHHVCNLIARGVQPPYVGKRLHVIVDYSSPNIAKEMHVGHLRSTIIGDCLSRLFAFVGHEVERVNHVGDWGTQFGMLLANLFDQYPDVGQPGAPEPNLSNLQAFYKDAKKRFDNEEDFKKRAYQYVVALQSNEPRHIAAWKVICDVSRREFQLIYGRLDIKDLKEVGESFYQSRMKEVVKELKEKALLEEDEGRLILWPHAHTKPNEVPLIVVKSDGAYTYDTSDLAAIRYRLQERVGDWLVYVIDSGQAVHMSGIFGAAERIGWLNRRTRRVDHVGFGVVLDENNQKFRSRSGDTVRLGDLLDEGVQRARTRLVEKGRDKELTPDELRAVEQAVAYGCIKYSDLSHNRTLAYCFSFDKMLDDKGNTAVYLLYAYTRIRSIARNAKLDLKELQKQAANLDAAGLQRMVQEPSEWRLAKQLLRFAEVVHRMLEDLMPHVLCEYLFDLATYYTEFYDQCYCIERNRTTGEIIRINTERIMLCEATASVLRAGFEILGLRTLERM